MPFEYEINGQVITTETELSEDDINEIAASIQPIPVDTADLSGAEDFGFIPPTQEELEGTIAFRRGAQEGFTRLGEGIQQIGYGIGEKIGMVSPQEREALNRQIAKERVQYLAQPLSQTGWGKTGELYGEAVPAVVVPGGVAGGLVRKTLTSGLAGGTTAGVLPTASGDLMDAERAANIALGTTLGAGTTGVLHVVPRAVKAAGDFLKPAKGKVQQIVGREDIDTGVQNIADEYGIQLTPGEASGLQEVLAAEEGLRTMTPEAATQLGRFIRGRMGKIDMRVNELLEDIISNEPVVAERIVQGYNNLSRTKLKDNVVDGLFDLRVADPKTGREINLGPMADQYFNKMKRTQGWATQLEGVPDKSALQFDMFKRFLDEEQDKLFKAGKTQASRNIQLYKDKMVEQLDYLVPDYANTRSLAGLSITRSNLQKELDQIPTKQKAIGATGETIEVTDPIEFFKKTMKKDSDFETLKRKLSASPNAVEKLTKLRTLLSAIEKSPMQRMVSATGETLPETGGGGSLGGQAGAATYSALNFFQRKRSEEMINYITNDNWGADLLDSVDPTMLEKGGVAAYEQLSRILSRTAALATVPEPQTPELQGIQPDITVTYPQ